MTTSETNWMDVLGQLSGMLPEAHPTPQITLRPHQQTALVTLFQSFQRGVKRPLVNMPTGAGKTIFAGHVSLRFKTTLFLVPKEELLHQTISTFKRLHPDIEVGMIWGNRTDLNQRIVVGMIQTVFNRLKDIPRDHFELVVVDEAHHSMASTWRTVIEHFNHRMLLGLSATPERLDGAPLSHLFDEVVYSLSLEKAMELELLVKLHAVRVRTMVNIDHVALYGADLNEQQLQKAVNVPERNRLMVESHLKFCKGRKAIVYACGTQHAIDLANMFNEHGISAAAVWGDDPRKNQKLQDSRKGKIEVLTNTNLLVEGYDDPELSAAHMGRPTSSKNFFVQAIGRVLRLSPGKKDAMVVDFTDNTTKHNLHSAWQFYGTPDYQEPTPIGLKRRGVRSIMEIDDGFERYRKLAGELNYLQFVQQVNLLYLPPDVDSFTFGDKDWHSTPATDKQLEILMANGYDITRTEWTKGQAQAVIMRFPPTVNQLLTLLSFGYDIFTRTWNRMQASVAITEAKSSKQKPDWDHVLSLLPHANELKASKN